MQILSVDLAHTAYDHLGIVVLDGDHDEFSVRTLAPSDLGLGGPPSPHELATQLGKICRRLPASILLLDGPQGWKDPSNGLQHSRICERELNTPAKTGPPGSAKPANYLPFVAFSITVFHCLVAEGFKLWSGPAAPLLALESFPLSAWRQLGIRPLPAKSKARPEDLQRAVADLTRVFPMHVDGRLSHDEVQALVAALAGVAVARGHNSGYATAGVAPRLLDGTWREGFIVNPTLEAMGSCV